MRGEGIGEAEFGRQHRTETTRSQNPQLHFRPRGRDSLDALIWTGRGQKGLHLENVLRLWQEKRGEVEPEDLSEALLVQLAP